MNLKPGSLVVTATKRLALTSLPVKSIRQLHGFSGTHVISVEAPAEIAAFSRYAPDPILRTEPGL